MKDFQRWHSVKKGIEQRSSPFFAEREIWWCSLGENVGSEEDGKHDLFERPVLIVRKFHKDLLWIIPLTSTLKESPFYFPLDIHGRKGSVLLSQLRTISSKRLFRRLAKVHPNVFSQVKRALVGLYKETDPLRGPQVPNGNL